MLFIDILGFIIKVIPILFYITVIAISIFSVGLAIYMFLDFLKIY